MGKLISVPEASRLYGMSIDVLRYAIKNGTLPCVKIGVKAMLDIEDVAWFAEKRDVGHLVQIGEVSERTGLSACAIRRGVHEGWIPARVDGRAWLFDMDEVMTAINEKLNGR